MPRTFSTTTYAYKELSREAKKVAVTKVNEIANGWSDYSEEIEECFANDLEAFGYPSDQIGFSFSYSQGDGMAFYGGVDINKWLAATRNKTKYKSLIDSNGDSKITVSISKNDYGFHYSHYNTMSFDWDADTVSAFEMTDKQIQLANQLCLAIETHARDTSRKLEKSGYEIIEYRQSEENFRENLMHLLDEYEFNRDGTVYE